MMVSCALGVMLNPPSRTHQTVRLVASSYRPLKLEDAVRHASTILSPAD